MTSKFNNYLTNEEKEQIISMYFNGMNTVEIAKVLNRNNSSIGRYIKKQGYENKGTNSKLTKVDLENIKQLYISGLTSKEIYLQYTEKVGCE